jgi:valyl-tRNA synthetase
MLPNKALIEALSQSLANSTLGQISDQIAEPPNAVPAAFGPFEIYMEGAMEVSALNDPTKGAKRREELTKQIATLRGRLASSGYVDKAPQKLVEQTRQQLAAAESELSTLL